MYRGIRIEALRGQVLQGLVVVCEGYFDSEMMQRRHARLATVPGLALAARGPVTLEQTDDLGVPCNAVGDPQEGDRTMQYPDQFEAEDVAVEGDRAVEIGDPDDDLADAERPDRIACHCYAPTRPSKRARPSVLPRSGPVVFSGCGICPNPVRIAQ